ncbi:MAG: hypothetical protein UFP03_06510 [Paludibacteraceae bacterium]|nr:hypothetical protein [Paludibacteraceae bacterium]
MEEIIKLTLDYIKGLSLVIIVFGIAYIVYNRKKVKVVSLNDIISWANQNKGIGTNMYVSRLSIMPEQVRRQVKEEIGLKTLINGYKEETSMFVTVLDDEDNIISSSYFMGTKLDEDLEVALGNKTGVNIKLN